mmetsp:Transcript_10844/g.28487  ORF Transcript_10844/g.28487 Transcript_10844/m.28487 type:complete len:224 (-) Transcript_10844:917-1588(-)
MPITPIAPALPPVVPAMAPSIEAMAPSVAPPSSCPPCDVPWSPTGAPTRSSGISGVSLSSSRLGSRSSAAGSVGDSESSPSAAPVSGTSERRCRCTSRSVEPSPLTIGHSDSSSSGGVDHDTVGCTPPTAPLPSAVEAGAPPSASGAGSCAGGWVGRIRSSRSNCRCRCCCSACFSRSRSASATSSRKPDADAGRLSSTTYSRTSASEPAGTHCTRLRGSAGT